MSMEKILTSPTKRTQLSQSTLQSNTHNHKSPLLHLQCRRDQQQLPPIVAKSLGTENGETEILESETKPSPKTTESKTSHHVRRFH